jgi:hypothetical protein
MNAAAPRPRLKTSAPLLRGGGELHIVGSHDITSIPDPDGAIHRLVELADGSRSTPELVIDLQSDYPQIGEQDVVDAVFQLESVGLFVDCAPRHRILGDRDTRLMHLV